VKYLLFIKNQQTTVSVAEKSAQTQPGLKFGSVN
jgi:hypothetical protein